MDSSVGLLGVKLGMSRIFNEQGASVPVTVIYADTNRVCQLKTKKTDGYDAVQLAAGTRKAQRTSKALGGHYKKAGVPFGHKLAEFRIRADADVALGTEVTVGHFVTGQKVDLTGISKGRGFAGAVKRWNFAMQDATHGNSLSHRHLGSTGQCQFPGRVFKGKKMAGHYGAERVTTMRLEVADIDEENRLILIKGAVPGSRGGWVVVRPSVKESPPEREKTEKLMREREEQRQLKEQEAADAAAKTEDAATADDGKPEAEAKPDTAAKTEDAADDGKPEAEAKPDTEAKTEDAAMTDGKKPEAKPETEAKPDAAAKSDSNAETSEEQQQAEKPKESDEQDAGKDKNKK